jgi:hypothetical protein
VGGCDTPMSRVVMKSILPWSILHSETTACHLNVTRASGPDVEYPLPGLQAAPFLASFFDFCRSPPNIASKSEGANLNVTVDVLNTLHAASDPDFVPFHLISAHFAPTTTTVVLAQRSRQYRPDLDLLQFEKPILKYRYLLAHQPPIQRSSLSSAKTRKILQ